MNELNARRMKNIPTIVVPGIIKKLNLAAFD